MDIVHLNFSKAFLTVSHNILAGKLRKRGVHEWTEGWIWSWLNGRSQRAVTHGTGEWCPLRVDTDPSVVWLTHP